MKTKEIKKLTQDQLFSELEKLKKEQFKQHWSAFLYVLNSWLQLCLRNKKDKI